MPYYHGNTRLNLYSASSSRYPTSDSSGRSCQTYLPAIPSKGGSLTLDNNTFSLGSLTAYKDSKNGTKIGDRLTLGSSSYDVYNYGGRSYNTAPFYADGATIYYDVSTSDPSVPIVYVLIRAVELNITDPNGNNYYKYLKVEGADGSTYQWHSITTADEYFTVTMNGNRTITITSQTYDYYVGSSSGSANPGWGTSYSFSGSWKTSNVPTELDLTVSINDEGSKTGMISLENGSWSGSWYSSSWKNTKITSISASTTSISFSATKSRTSQPNLTWSVKAYYAY